MPKFYLTLKVNTLNAGLVEGNDVMITGTALPELADFNEAKIAYCRMLHAKGIAVEPDKAIITMCVPCHLSAQPTRS